MGSVAYESWILPASMLRPDRWRVVFAAPLLHHEYTGVKEGRGALWALRRIASDPTQHSTRHLVLVDNFGLACVLSKGRASSFVGQVRRSWQRMWRGTSESNPADAPSRVSFGPRERSRHVGSSQPSWRGAYNQIAFASPQEGSTVGQAAGAPRLRPPVAPERTTGQPSTRSSVGVVGTASRGRRC